MGLFNVNIKWRSPLPYQSVCFNECFYKLWHCVGRRKRIELNWIENEMNWIDSNWKIYEDGWIELIRIGLIWLRIELNWIEKN